MSIYFYDTLPSTMDEARSKVLEGVEEGAVIVALEQTKGRGRRGRFWESPPGNLYMTYITYRDIPLSKAPLLSFVACVAVGETLRPFLPPGNFLTYKWPNDIFLNYKKVSGLLLEAFSIPGKREIAYLIGCGLNLTMYPQKARYPATSFQNEGMYFSLKEVLGKIVISLQRHINVFQEQGFDSIRTLWMEGAGGLEEKIALEFQGKIREGIFKGIDEDGALLLDASEGVVKLTVGEILNLGLIPMLQHEIRPPWVEYPDISPDNIFWRQEGEPWARYVWLPYWATLTEEQREKLIDQWKAPEKWREFYDKEFQDWLATQDGPVGWILRNNLCPVDDDKPRYISAVTPSNYSQSSVFLSWSKKLLWWAAVIGIAIIVRRYFY